ncbi:MAG: hypothetical protein ACJ79V_09525 [Myxococcales bacterium]
MDSETSGGAPGKCSKCGAELIVTGRPAQAAYASGLCSGCWLDAPARGVTDLVAAAYRILATRSFRDCAGDPTDPESGALQSLLDGIDALEGGGPRHVVHCQACSTAPHNGLKHSAGSSLGAVGAACQVPGCRCPGYHPAHVEDAR